jgi:serine/threonine protein kinase
MRVSTDSACPVQGFCKEVVGWKALRHPNVLPLLGATMTETRFVMVSEWMMNGNINQFVKADVNADRSGLVRI